MANRVLLILVEYSQFNVVCIPSTSSVLLDWVYFLILIGGIEIYFICMIKHTMQDYNHNLHILISIFLLLPFPPPLCFCAAGQHQHILSPPVFLFNGNL